jgi:hypothetical protein
MFPTTSNMKNHPTLYLDSELGLSNVKVELIVSDNNIIVSLNISVFTVLLEKNGFTLIMNIIVSIWIPIKINNYNATIFYKNEITAANINLLSKKKNGM